ncbi:uncharacterized protein LOC122261151 [Penaeus japonicus]|uniref:uncharacterized protein LOC122261151 n=1 Tax=Penaeus japonicus TaxID=27405 RepID=UPI001C7117BA|nr:uncharacterized protein LOC122261151 [Penaeus japonicus]
MAKAQVVSWEVGSTAKRIVAKVVLGQTSGRGEKKKEIWCLEGEDGQRKTIRIAKQRNKQSQDVYQAKLVKDTNGNVLTDNQQLKNRWKEYYQQLMNVENPRTERVITPKEEREVEVSLTEVTEAIKQMKRGKSVRPDDIPVEAWKVSTDAIFAWRQIIEKYRIGQKDLHSVFNDMEKAYDRIPRQEVWNCLRLKEVEGKHIRLIKDMYERSKTRVRCAAGETEDFEVTVGLHQGSALSPSLFAIIMDCTTREMQGDHGTMGYDVCG